VERGKMSKKITINTVLFGIRNKIVHFIPESSWLFRCLSIWGMRLNSVKNRKKRDVMKIDIPIVEHCNLRCKGCTAFSPIAEEEFMDYEQYCKDMSRLAELTNHNLSEIVYTGGEPLLHPRFSDFIQFARRLYPKAEISFMTNGVLIPVQTEFFWKICHDCGVKVRVSRYPIKLDNEKIYQIEKKYQVVFDWVGGKDVPIKKMWKYPIDVEGKTSLRNSFKMCSQVNSCIRMKQGRIYPCNTTACIEHFNKYFHKNLKLIPGKDYLELEKVKNIQEIFTFLITPPRFVGIVTEQVLRLAMTGEYQRKIFLSGHRKLGLSDIVRLLIKIFVRMKKVQKYSVLMSVYAKDKPEYLIQAVDSMMNQTIPPEQFVIVIDGPVSNEIADVIHRYKDDNPSVFTIVPLEVNGGLGNEMNEGLKHCRNELVARMDADDISLPTRCEKELEMFEKYPKLVLCGTHIDEFYDNPRNVHTMRKVPTDYESIKKFIRRRQPFNHPTVMFKKSEVIRCGSYGHLKRKQDFDLFSRMINNDCYALNIDESLLKFRADQDNYKRRKSWNYVKSSIYVGSLNFKRGYCSIIDLAY